MSELVVMFLFMHERTCVVHAAHRGSDHLIWMLKLEQLFLNLFLSYRYMRLYGRKFSKEDHVLFIKLLYELVTIPKLEISMMQGLARLLINLLK